MGQKAGRRLSLSFLVLVLSFGPAVAQYGDIIRQIVVEGTQRVEPSTVRSYLLIQEGDPYDPGRIDRSLKSLYATGLFADVAIRREGDRLIVSVTENPIINRVAFEGNDKLDDKTLEAEISLRPRVIYTRPKVQSDVNRILNLYRRSGRFAATVDPKIIRLEQNRVDVVFEINEGKVTSIESIRFIGNRAFSESDLREVIRTKESRWWRFLSTEDTYDPDRLSLDRELLRRFYLSEGYADFRVQSAVAELTPDRSEFLLTITVEEGERYRFGKIDMESTVPGLSADALRNVVAARSGDWYDADKVEKSIDAINNAAGDLGYAFVDVRPQIQRNRDERTIDVNFLVNEGPRVFVERIEISGNVRTKDDVIRREFRFAEGDAFNAAKLRRSRQRIQDLDFFEKVDVDQVQGSAPDRAVVKVHVEEKSTGSLSIGAGFSTASGILGDLSVRERNLLGRGQDLRATLLLGQKQQQVDLSFTEPYFMDRNIAAGFDLYYVQTDRRSESSFDTRTIGSALRAGYPITERLSQNWRYTLKRQTIRNVPDDASVFVKDAEGTDTVSEVSHSLTYDRRDSKINPTTGYFGKFTTDVAGLGGDVRYLRNRLDTGYYYPVSEKWVASLTGSVGYIFGLGEDERLLDRFFIGGEEVRGFATDGIGPRDRDTGDALGGQWFYASSAQLTFPLGLPEEYAIRGRAFTDVGAAWELSVPSDQRDLVEDSADPRVSVGTGVTWLSPFGPLGVDVGFPLIKKSFDKTELLRVNFGTRF
jgi:outer membrane protein insertion porin family